MFDSDSHDDIFLHNSKSMITRKTTNRPNNYSSDEHFNSLISILKNHYQNLAQLNLSWSSTNAFAQPIEVIPYDEDELVGVFNLVNSDNTFMNKVIATFAILEAETDNVLRNTTERLLFPILTYGENLDDSEQIETGEAEIQIARMLPVLTEIMEVTVLLFSLAINLINQMLSLYNKNLKNYKDSFAKIKLHSPFETLSKILGFLIKVETIVKDNENLCNHWQSYCEMFFKCSVDSENFGFSAAQAHKLGKVIKKLDGSIFSENFLEFCIEYLNNETGNLSNTGVKSPVSANDIFVNFLKDYLSFKIEKLTKDIDFLTETDEKSELMGFFGLFAYFSYTTRVNFDKSFFKKVWYMNYKITYIPVLEHVSLEISSFLVRLLMGNKLPTVDPKDPRSLAINTLDKYMTGVPNLVKNVGYQVQTWLVKMRSNVISKHDNLSVQQLIVSKTKNIVNGIIICFQARNCLDNVLNTHLALQKELDSRGLKHILALVNYIKVIELEFKTKQIDIALCFEDILTNAVDGIVSQINKAANSYLVGNLNAHSSDIKAAVDIFVNVLANTRTPLRLIVAKHAFDVVKSKVLFSSDQIKEIDFLFWRLKLLKNHREILAKVTNLSFLYWYRDLVPEFISRFQINENNIVELQFFLKALEDTGVVWERSKHLEESITYLKKYQADFILEIEKNLFEEAAKNIENDVRLVVHEAMIKEVKVEAFLKVKHSVKYVNLQPMLFFNTIINPKRSIEKFLNKLFYEMAALNLHDHCTYEKMRAICKINYDLDLTPAFLPSQSLSQGIDLLYIVRNLGSFVSQFNYNIQSQSFIEVSTDSSTLSVIGVEQVMSSLNTHGIGILNTVVNKTYQLIKKKIKAIANFIVNQYVKSTLIILERNWLENKDKLDLKFPYGKAEHLLKEIVGMGVAKDGTTYADKLRVYISQIGNTLALIRTIRSALMQFKSQNLKFTKGEMNKLVESFEDLDGEEFECVKEITAVFKETLGLLDSHKENRVNYMSTLITIFDSFLNEESLEELKQFYLICPSITINYIENIIVSNEKVVQKKIKDAYFCNDGFILGLTFLLKVFKQEQAFDGIHWFKSALERMEVKKTPLKIREGGYDESMSKRKLDTYKTEIELLQFAYTSSVVLFNDY